MLPGKQPTTMPVPARPRFDIGTDLLPAPKIEIADAEIGASRQLYRLAKRGEKLLIDIVEDSWHGVEPLLIWLIAAILRELGGGCQGRGPVQRNQEPI